MDFKYDEDEILKEILEKIKEKIDTGKFQSAKDLSIIYQNIKCEKIIEKQK